MAFSFFRHLARRFWNHTCTRASVNSNRLARSSRMNTSGYCVPLNVVSSSCSWNVENVVRDLLEIQSKKTNNEKKNCRNIWEICLEWDGKKDIYRLVLRGGCMSSSLVSVSDIFSVSESWWCSFCIWSGSSVEKKKMKRGKPLIKTSPWRWIYNLSRMHRKNDIRNGE